MATSESNTQEDDAKRQLYYKKSKYFKIENNAMNSIDINEVFSFELNDTTKCLNICIWAKVMNKSKLRNTLVGYVCI